MKIHPTGYSGVVVGHNFTSLKDFRGISNINFYGEQPHTNSIVQTENSIAKIQQFWKKVAFSQFSSVSSFCHEYSIVEN